MDGPTSIAATSIVGLVIRVPFGPRNTNALCHGMGHLPEPDFPHRFS